MTNSNNQVSVHHPIHPQPSHGGPLGGLGPGPSSNLAAVGPGCAPGGPAAAQAQLVYQLQQQQLATQHQLQQLQQLAQVQHQPQPRIISSSTVSINKATVNPNLASGGTPSLSHAVTPNDSASVNVVENQCHTDGVGGFSAASTVPASENSYSAANPPGTNTNSIMTAPVSLTGNYSYSAAPSGPSFATGTIQAPTLGMPNLGGFIRQNT